MKVLSPTESSLGSTILPLPAVSVCGRSLLFGQLERAAEELLGCWLTHESDGQIYPNLPTGQNDGKFSKHETQYITKQVQDESQLTEHSTTCFT